MSDLHSLIFSTKCISLALSDSKVGIAHKFNVKESLSIFVTGLFFLLKMVLDFSTGLKSKPTYVCIYISGIVLYAVYM